MKMKAIHALLAIALAVTVMQGAPASDYHNGKSVGCNAKCPSCRHICRAYPVTNKIKKSYFEVSCKQICIPAITFPWQKCCEPRCGKVITVKTLKKVSYSCERCGYKWKIEPCGCGSCTSSPMTAKKVEAARSDYFSPPLPSVSFRKPLVQKAVRQP